MYITFLVIYKKNMSCTHRLRGIQYTQTHCTEERFCNILHDCTLQGTQCGSYSPCWWRDGLQSLNEVLLHVHRHSWEERAKPVEGGEYQATHLPDSYIVSSSSLQVDLLHRDTTKTRDYNYTLM